MTKQEEQLLMQQLSDPTTQRKAFEQVVREYGEQLYWQIRRLVLVHEDADDVLQNVFIKAWSHLDDFHQDSRLSTWLYRIAVNESLDFLRKQKNNSMIHTDDVESGVANMLVADAGLAAGSHQPTARGPAYRLYLALLRRNEIQ